MLFALKNLHIVVVKAWDKRGARIEADNAAFGKAAVLWAISTNSTCKYSRRP